MKRDSLFFRFFEDLPSTFFQLVGRPVSQADRYELKAIEYEETAVRLDGVFMPRRPGTDPAYIWEVQYHPSDHVYANLMAKIGRFLDHGDPKQDFVGVVIYRIGRSSRRTCTRIAGGLDRTSWCESTSTISRRRDRRDSSSES